VITISVVTGVAESIIFSDTIIPYNFYDTAHARPQATQSNSVGETTTGANKTSSLTGEAGASRLDAEGQKTMDSMPTRRRQGAHYIYGKKNSQLNVFFGQCRQMQVLEKWQGIPIKSAGYFL
jgi:hypothetical protein